jgi:phage tail sheath protein FI
MAYERPGVYVQEGTFATNIAQAQGPTAAAFLGTAERGPTTPTLITTWAAYKALFGDLDPEYDLGYAIYHYFANGGQSAYVSRVADSAAVKASGSLSATPTGGSPAVLTAFVAKSVGTWGNSLTVDLEFQAETINNPTTDPKITKSSLFTVTVNLAGTEVERWAGLSFNPADNRYITSVLETYSSYVTSASVATIGATETLTVVGVSVGDLKTPVTLSSGSEGGSITAPDWATTLTSYETIVPGLLFNLVGQTSSTIINNALSVMSVRGNSFLIIDSPLTATTKQTLADAVEPYTKSSYGGVYGPALKMFDPTKTGAAAVRNTYPGGAVAGAFVRSEVSRGIAKAPAGYGLDIRNVYGLVATLSETDQGTLYKNSQLNLFTLVPGVGVIINGARTQARNTSDKFVSVRRSLNFLKDILKTTTAPALFEPNDERLWTDLNVRISALLNNFWGAGGLKGRTAQEAFFVNCGAANNTALDIENGIVNIEVGVALQSPAEFIVITISQWTGGSTVTTSI